MTFLAGLRTAMRRRIAGVLLSAGVSPNAVTVAGTIGVLAGVVWYGATGGLLAGVIVVAVSSYADLLDGEMARMGDRRTTGGAFLDSTLDRLADGAIFGCLAYRLLLDGRQRAAALALVCLVAAYMVSYSRARAESLGYRGEFGMTPRFVRLEIIGAGALLAGLGVPYTLEAALWVLAAASTLTVVQRMAYVMRQADAADTAERGRRRSARREGEGSSARPDRPASHVDDRTRPEPR
ncbi:MAG: phosphatidylinositol phosphate synthase [Mycobacteriales bacterium]